jgi:DNA adenine methylase
MKPLIRWAGGKQAIVSQIYDLFPKTNTVECYYEPFLGAGSVFFFNNFKNAVLSDLNNELINFYVYVRDKPKDFYKRLMTEIKYFDEDKYYKCRTLFNKKLNTNSLAQAVRFFLLNKYNYNGIYRVNQNGFYNVPFGKPVPTHPSLDEIILVSNHLKGIKLVNFSYEKILEYVKANDFVYLDPPYPPLNKTSMFRHYTANRFGDEDQYMLAQFCKELDKRGVKFFMSNANTETIISLFNEFEIIEIEKTRFVSCKSTREKGKELYIRNYHA